MKVYSISSPEKLRDITEGIKWDRDYRAAMAFADKWDGAREAYTVTLEFGKSAIIMVDDGASKKPLATMYTAAARDCVKELIEI